MCNHATICNYIPLLNCVSAECTSFMGPVLHEEATQYHLPGPVYTEEMELTIKNVMVGLCHALYMMT